MSDEKFKPGTLVVSKKDKSKQMIVVASLHYEALVEWWEGEDKCGDVMQTEDLEVVTEKKK